jgi:hypothetical protein
MIDAAAPKGESKIDTFFALHREILLTHSAGLSTWTFILEIVICNARDESCCPF